MRLTRRRFGQGIGAAVALTTNPLHAHDGPHEIEVEISDFVFAPAMIEVLAGDTVIWTNKDIAPHTASAEDGEWDTGTLERNQRAEIKFDTPGTFAYFCAFHPHMTGIVQVNEKPSG